MEKKPKIYKTSGYKKYNNNQDIYYTQNNMTKINSPKNNNDIIKKIESIINSKSFIYCKKVIIELQNETITKKIIGIKNNNLVTIDNEMIPINEIQNILIF